MEYRKLGNSGALVSVLALGTMNFGTPQTPEDEAFAQLDAFIEAGGNLIDTADVYNGGIAEETLGRWLTSRPTEVTHRAVIATKGRTRTGSDPNDAGTSRRHLDRALATSPRRLGTDTIDLYQLHAWDPLTPIEETLSFLDSAVRAGKIRYAGLSNFTGWQLQLAVSTARAAGYQVPVTLQAQYSLATRETKWEMIPAALHNGLGILAWSPLASGFLTGKYQRGGKRPADTRAGQDHALYQCTSSNYENSDRTWNAVDAVNQVAKETGVSPAQVSLSWVTSQPGRAGCTRRRQRPAPGTVSLRPVRLSPARPVANGPEARDGGTHGHGLRPPGHRVQQRRVQAPPAAAADETAEDFDRVNAVNLRGVWASMKHELRQMREQGTAAIVSCSSLGGLVGLPQRAAYHASKHGVIGLTRSVAVEYAPKGIRVNAVCPGVIDTPMVADMLQGQAGAMAEIMKQQSAGRLGRAEEIAAAVLWLCSPGASFVTGAALPVDGGFTAH